MAAATLSRDSRANRNCPYAVDHRDRSRSVGRHARRSRHFTRIDTASVLAEQGYVPSLRFPSGDSVYMHGWDGQTNADAASAYVPAGWAGWEIGVDQAVKKKADSVYDDRSKSIRAQSSGNVISVRHASAAGSRQGLGDKKKAENRWRDVRVLDAVDLIQWIERHPGVALWLAALIGKTPAGIRDLKEFWREWSAATRRPISTGLVTADRDDEATRALRWLYEDPSVLSLQAELPTRQSHSFMLDRSTNANHVDYYSTRTVVVTDADRCAITVGIARP